MSSITEKNKKLALDKSASLLLDVLEPDFVASSRVVGADIPDFGSQNESSNAIVFLDGVDGLLEQIVKEMPVGGNLALAFDNRYGFRYLSGLPKAEGEPAFKGLEEGEGHTLGEIKGKLAELGFKDIYVHYPFPDYRFPKIIYSEGLLPEKGSLRNLIGGVGKDRIVTFDEEMAFDAAIDSGDFSMFAPCYWIVAKRGKKA